MSDYHYRHNSDAQKQAFSKLLRMTKEQIDNALALKEQGESFIKIAKKMKLNESTLRRTLHQELILREMEGTTTNNDQN